MCTCHSAQQFLMTLHIPLEIQDKIIEYTKIKIACTHCNKIIAQSIHSYCKFHTSSNLTCTDCTKKKMSTWRTYEDG